MCRAVHGLQGVGLRSLGHHGEHVVAVVLPVARALPQRGAVQGGGHHLVKAPLAVLALVWSGESRRPSVKVLGGMAKGQTVLTQGRTG